MDFTQPRSESLTDLSSSPLPLRPGQSLCLVHAQEVTDSPGSNPPVRTGKMGQNRSPALRVTTLHSDCGQRGPRAPLLYSSPASLSPPPGKPSAVCPRPRWFQRRSGGTTSDPEFPALLEGPRVPAIPQHVMARSGHVFLPMALTTSHSWARPATPSSLLPCGDPVLSHDPANPSW